MKTLNGGILAAFVAALALSGCGQSVDQRFESTVRKAAKETSSPSEAETYRSILETAEYLSREDKQAWLDAYERVQKANREVEKVEAEGRAKGYL